MNMNTQTKMGLMLMCCTFCCMPSNAQWTRKTNLPTVYVNTENNAPITSKENYLYSTLRYVDEKDKVTTYDSTQIRGRGNSTWNLKKKPYRLKFNKKEKFLGKERANAKSWTLIANAGDKTMIRNAVTNSLGEFTSLKFNPAYKFVDFVLNNTYNGTYQISDQIEVRKKRVDITEQDYPLADSSDISGGYFLEVDGFKDGNYFTTSHYNVPIRIHYPDEDEIVASQNNYIKNYVQTFENALYSSSFADSVKGYRQYVDSVSLADWYICTEVSANIDGFYSIYFYKDQQDPRLYWGPLWDYDIAYGNDTRMWTEQHLQTTAYSMMTDIGYGQAKNWMNRMWEDPWFSRLINRRYQELLDAGLVDHMNATIDSLTTLLDESQKLNYQKWGINTKMYHETVLYSSYDKYIADLKQFISDHTAWLKTEFANRKAPEPTPAFKPLDYYYRIVSANTSKAIEVSNGNSVTQYTNVTDRETADWYMRPTTTGDYFQIINRSNNMALNDPTTGSVTPTTNVGTHLNVVNANEKDESQLWQLVPQGTQGYYNLLNVHTQHVANLQGGSNADNTPILSYTNDARNETSKNRLWYLIPTKTPLSGDITGIATVEPEAYALAYNQSSQILHFGSETPSQLSFGVKVYAANGALVGQFSASENFSVANLPLGVYIVSWQVGGQKRSAKFYKK